MRMMYGKLLCSAGIAGMALGSTPALSQATQIDAETAAGNQQAGVNDIVITARRRAESIQNVPVSVTAFGTNDLESRNARQVSDLLSTVPNVNANNGLQIRGIGYDTRNIGIEAGATVYVDGVYTGRPSTFDQDLTDIASVQVLRGPQGTLYGKNSIAGVIDLSTTEPKLNFEGNGRIDVGNRNRRRGDITINVPLAPTLAFRTSFTKSSYDGWVKNLADDQVFGGSDSTNIRAALRWDATPDLKIIVRADHQQTDENPRARAESAETLLGDDPQIDPPRPIIAPGKYTTFEDTVTDSKTTLQGVSLTLQYSASPAFNLTSITAYRENEYNVLEGQDNSPLNRIEVDFANRQKQFTHEMRGAGTIGFVDYVAGFYYFNQDSRQSNRGILGTDFAIPPLGIPGGVKKVIDPNAQIKTESVAGYVDLTLKLSERLEVLAGARINHEKKKFAFQITSDAPAIFYSIPFGRDEFSQTDFSPTLGLRYHVTRDLMTYARYAKGFKSGGWNADFSSAAPGQPAPTIPSLRFEAENAETFEIGFKSAWLDRRLILNGSAFQTNFNNLQVAQFFGINIDSGNPLAVTANAGKARIKGFELEATAVPVDGLTLSGGIGYLDATYLDFDNVDGRGTSADGRRMQGVPKLTGNASIQYQQPLENGGSLSVRADYQGITERSGDPLGNPLRRAPASWTANARLTYAAPDDRWKLSGFATNLFNRQNAILYDISQFAVAQAQPVRTVLYAEPRIYGVSLEFKF